MKQNNFVITGTVVGREVKRMAKFYTGRGCNVRWVGVTTNYNADQYEYNTVDDPESLDDNTTYGLMMSIDTYMNLITIIRRDLDSYENLSVYLQVNRAGDYNLVEKATISRGALIKYNRVSKIVLDLSRFVSYEEFVAAYTGNDKILEAVDIKVFKNCRKNRKGILALTPEYDVY